MDSLSSLPFLVTRAVAVVGVIINDFVKGFLACHVSLFPTALSSWMIYMHPR